MLKLFFKGKIEMMKKSFQKFVSFLYIVVDKLKKKLSFVILLPPKFIFIFYHQSLPALLVTKL
jgi:hypothetical protein